MLELSLLHLTDEHWRAVDLSDTMPEAPVHPLIARWEKELLSD